MKPSRNFPLLLASQFLGAFGDNALLAIIVGQLTIQFKVGTISREQLQTANAIYTVLLFVPFVLLAPIAGFLNDRFPKTRWLLGGNLIKLLGCVVGLMSVWFGPLWQGVGYLIVGVGACVYSPAKYGILPEILPAEKLVKANGAVEFLTLVAILTGGIGGSWMVDDHPVTACYGIMIGVFAASLALNALMTATPYNPQVQVGRSVLEFFQNVRGLLGTPRLARILMGTGLFWISGAVLKMNFQPWGLDVLKLGSNTQIAMLGLWLSIGVMGGSVLAGILHRVGELQSTRRYGWALAVTVAVLGLVQFVPSLTAWRIMVLDMGALIVPVVIVLALAGLAAGLFLIPLNAALQAECPQDKLGKTIATQNAVENLAMLFGGGCVVTGVKLGLGSSGIFLALSALLLVVVFFLKIPTRQTANPGHQPHE